MSIKDMKDHELAYPTLAALNSKGRPMFTLKHKGEAYGQLFYIFQVLEENIESEDDRRKVRIAVDFTREVAKQLGVPLYLFEDIEEAVASKLRSLDESGTPFVPSDVQSDIIVRITDQATGMKTNLTIGVSSAWPPGGRTGLKPKSEASQ